MRIQWLGHSCFLFTNAQGHSLLTDPFGSSVGYPVPKARADVVTISHSHHDHNHVDELAPGFVRLDSAGRYSGFGFDVDMIESWHDDADGAKRGANLIALIEADGLRIAHLGDLGQILTAKQITRMGHLDLMLVPVGGHYTLDDSAAYRIVWMIEPRVTIPMHYKTEWSMGMDIQTERPFVAAAGGEYVGKDTIEITAETLDQMPKVIVMEFSDPS